MLACHAYQTRSVADLWRWRSHGTKCSVSAAGPGTYPFTDPLRHTREERLRGDAYDL